MKALHNVHRHTGQPSDRSGKRASWTGPLPLIRLSVDTYSSCDRPSCAAIVTASKRMASAVGPCLTRVATSLGSAHCLRRRSSPSLAPHAEQDRPVEQPLALLGVDVLAVGGGDAHDRLQVRLVALLGHLDLRAVPEPLQRLDERRVRVVLVKVLRLERLPRDLSPGFWCRGHTYTVLAYVEAHDGEFGSWAVELILGSATKSGSRSGTKDILHAPTRAPHPSQHTGLHPHVRVRAVVTTLLATPYGVQPHAHTRRADSGKAPYRSRTYRVGVGAPGVSTSTRAAARRPAGSGSSRRWSR